MCVPFQWKPVETPTLANITSHRMGGAGGQYGGEGNKPVEASGGEMGSCSRKRERYTKCHTNARASLLMGLYCPPNLPRLMQILLTHCIFWIRLRDLERPTIHGSTPVEGCPPLLWFGHRRLSPGAEASLLRVPRLCSEEACLPWMALASALSLPSKNVFSTSVWGGGGRAKGREPRSPFENRHQAHE